MQKSPANFVSSFAFGLISDNLSKIVASLEKNSIETRPLICGSMGEQPFWIDRYGKQILPIASLVHNKGFYVPCHQNMTEEDINKICDILIAQT